MYLIRQVAASDATERGRPNLSDYYSAKGESPGTWMGRGLRALGRPVSRDPSDPLVADLWGVAHGSQVSEDQMKALFGEGLHPNADRITRHLTGLGVGQAGAIAAARLGRPFAINNAENQFVTRLRQAYRDYNLTVGSGEHDSIAAGRPGPYPHRTWARNVHRNLSLAPPPMTGSSRVSSPAIRGRPPPPWPAMTSRSPRSNPSRRCGRSPRRPSRRDRGMPPPSRGRNAGISRRTGRVFAHGRPRCGPGQHHRIDRRGLRSPRLPRRGPQPAHPPGDQQQSASHRRRRHTALAGLRRHPAAPRHGGRLGVVQHPHRSPR